MWQICFFTLDRSRDKMAFINMDCSEKFDQARPTQDTWTGLLRLNAHETGNADLIRTYQVFA